MENVNILEIYETVADITDQMVDAARTADWDRLALLESQCSMQIAVLKERDAAIALTGEHRNKKVEIIRKILADDQQIRAITEPWMKQLSALMHSAGTERKLSQAYGPSSGS